MAIQPLIFEPYLKSVIWGGDKISRYKGIAKALPNIGESWEISAIPTHVSVVAQGEYKGATLNELIDKFGAELLGSSVISRYGYKFPLIVKILDAAENLSVQVHPDEEIARRRHNGPGKTEMLYIIDAAPEAIIYAGFKEKMTPEEYVKRVEDGTFAETLVMHRSAPGDVFFLPAGHVHAIGAGNLLAEVQEASDITYRIYDYGRVDTNGNARELHTHLAKEAINYNGYAGYKSLRQSEADKDCELVNCRHFVTRRLLLDGCEELDLDTDAFTVIMCVKGNAVIQPQEDNSSTATTELRQGTTALIPASTAHITLRGQATLLLIRP